MRKKIISAAIFTLFTILILDSCKPKISLSAEKTDSIEISFSTSFSKNTADALRKMTGAGEDIPIFAESDIKNLLSQAGAENTKVSISAPNELESSGKIKNISGNMLSKCGIISKSENSLFLSLGPEQFKNFYDLLSDEFKSYFDLMMIPSLINEKMSPSEYEELLSSMYGPSFAKDIVSGTLEISLSSPGNTKNIKDSVTLGEILTAQEAKIWSVTW